MGSSGGSDGYAQYMQQKYQQQQLALQKQQLAIQQRQHEESMAIQQEMLDEPVAAVSKDVSKATTDMVSSQQEAKNNLRGIRSTYSVFNKQNDEKLGE